jgi:hypothetical protein
MASLTTGISGSQYLVGQGSTMSQLIFAGTDYAIRCTNCQHAGIGMLRIDFPLGSGIDIAQSGSGSSLDNSIFDFMLRGDVAADGFGAKIGTRGIRFSNNGLGNSTNFFNKVWDGDIRLVDKGIEDQSVANAQHIWGVTVSDASTTGFMVAGTEGGYNNLFCNSFRAKPFGSAITTTGAVVASNVGTLTFGSDPTANGYVTGQPVTVTFFNGQFIVTAVTTNSISYALVHANAAAASNGQVSGAIATTAAAVASNVATLSLSGNPTFDFVAGQYVRVTGFTGGDTYFNGVWPITAVTNSSISYALVHANAAAASNGSIVGAGPYCAELAQGAVGNSLDFRAEQLNGGPFVITDPAARANFLALYNNNAQSFDDNSNGQNQWIITNAGPNNGGRIYTNTIMGQGINPSMDNMSVGLNVPPPTVIAQTIQANATFTDNPACSATAGFMRLCHGDAVRVRNNAGSADGLLFSFGSGLNADDFVIGGQNINSLFFNNMVTYGSPSSWSANGAVATALTSVGPTGSHTTVQKWLTVVDNTGATLYIPAF